MKRFLTAFAVFIAIHASIKAQEEKFMSLFIYNFTKLIDWPANNSPTFNVGVIDNDALYNELSSILSNKSTNNTPFKIIKLSNPDESSNCQIIVFNPSKKERVQALVEKTTNKSVLLVSDKAGACAEGAAICFTVKNGNLKYEVCKTNINNRALTISTQLFHLGMVVD